MFTARTPLVLPRPPIAGTAEEEDREAANSRAKEVTLMTQRTTMVLLLLLVSGVWGLLLRPAVTPIPIQAQNGGSSSGYGLISTTTGLYLHSPKGYIFHFGADLTLRDRAAPTIADPNTPTYTVVHERQ
jgi:hypothetical protein